MEEQVMMYRQSKQWWLFSRFCLLIVGLPILLFGYRSLGEEFLIGQLRFTAEQSAALLRLAGYSSEVHDAGPKTPVVLVTKDGDRKSLFDVAMDCGSMRQICLFCLLVLIFPSSWSYKALGWIVGAIVLDLTNTFRLTALAMVNLWWGRTALDFWHVYIMQMFYLTVVFVLFMVWLHYNRRFVRWQR